MVCVRGQEQVAGELLGDGRGALQRVAARAGRAPGRGAMPHRVEAEVVVEAPVLDGDEGGRHVGRQVVDIDRRRVLAAAHGDHRAGAVEIGDRGLALDVVELRGVRQVGGEDRHEADDEDRRPDAQDQRPVEQRAERPSACAPPGLRPIAPCSSRNSRASPGPRRPSVLAEPANSRYGLNHGGSGTRALLHARVGKAPLMPDALTPGRRRRQGIASGGSAHLARQAVADRRQPRVQSRPQRPALRRDQRYGRGVWTAPGRLAIVREAA